MHCNVWMTRYAAYFAFNSSKISRIPGFAFTAGKIFCISFCSVIYVMFFSFSAYFCRLFFNCLFCLFYIDTGENKAFQMLQMRDLLGSSDYAQFALVGSGVQRKVDRLTLGVQTVCHHVASELSNKYQMAVKERLSRIDPKNKVVYSNSLFSNQACSICEAKWRYLFNTVRKLTVFI